MNSLPTSTQVELLRLLMRNTVTAGIPCVAMAVLLFFSVHNEQNQLAIGLWTATSIAVTCLCTWHSRLRLKQQFSTDRIPVITTELTITNILDAATWGALAWVALDNATPAGSVMIIAAQMIIASGCMSSLAPVWPIFAMFLIIEVFTIGAKLLTMLGSAYAPLWLVAILYISTMIAQARNAHGAVRSAIELRFTNLALIEQLNTETNHANAAQKQAKAANLAKSQFLAAASHDLRQPVHAQKLFLDALSGSELTAWQRKSLHKALLASDTISQMLNTLLDASRIEAGTITPHMTSFRLQTLLLKLETDLSALADDKGIIYRYRDSLHTIDSDPVLLEQILRNLISNAIRYTHQGGILIGFRKRGNFLHIEVWDTGIGIDPAFHAQIFSEFFQVENPERDRHKGFGLGLAIAKGMAQTLGHTLSLRSVPGKGSCFSLCVPLAHHTQKDTTAISAITPVATKARLPFTVLMIDDDEDVLDAMHTLFAQWGCTCLLADGIASALQVVQQHTPDIIMSDYRLRNNTTGADAIAQLRTRLQSNVPAFLISGDTSPQRLQEALATGILLLQKPASADLLYNTVVLLTQTQDVQTMRGETNVQ